MHPKATRIHMGQPTETLFSIQSWSPRALHYINMHIYGVIQYCSKADESESVLPLSYELGV